MTSKNAIVDICIYIVDIHNDIFTSHNVFLDIRITFWISGIAFHFGNRHHVVLEKKFRLRILIFTVSMR